MAGRVPKKICPVVLKNVCLLLMMMVFFRVFVRSIDVKTRARILYFFVGYVMRSVYMGRCVRARWAQP